MNCEEDCFHLGAKALIRNRDGKLLLLEKVRRSNETYWDIPGGRLKKGESVLEALQREIYEELGLKKIKEAVFVDMHLTDIRIRMANKEFGLILSVYKYDVGDDFIPRISEEHCNFQWFHIYEAVQLLKSQYPSDLIKNVKQLGSEPILVNSEKR